MVEVKNPAITAFDALRMNAEKIGFGEWKVKLIIYGGEITGFDQLEAPLIKFRSKVNEK